MIDGYLIALKELEEKFKENASKHNVKFMAMFKPLFNVFEVICIKDPKNFINSEEFSLKYFDNTKNCLSLTFFFNHGKSFSVVCLVIR